MYKRQTPDNVYKEQAGFEALVHSAYAFWGGQFYGREDFVLLPVSYTHLDVYKRQAIIRLFPIINSKNLQEVLGWYIQTRWLKTSS